MTCPHATQIYKVINVLNYSNTSHKVHFNLNCCLPVKMHSTNVCTTLSSLSAQLNCNIPQILHSTTSAALKFTTRLVASIICPFLWSLSHCRKTNIVCMVPGLHTSSTWSIDIEQQVEVDFLIQGLVSYGTCSRGKILQLQLDGNALLKFDPLVKLCCHDLHSLVLAWVYWVYWEWCRPLTWVYMFHLVEFWKRLEWLPARMLS